ncbi:excalibur calcium-binding domain-containing protein [Arthrobacter sp. 3Tela_A]|uniref:excalibur calcium-binding domain-containing protein n=1 Tax=Arthrobacter sp. 3Tela_A TaxID=3093743 RepID=UPI003BB4E835
MKKTLTGLTLAAAFGFTALAASPAAAAPPYANCDAAAAEGVYNIPAGDPRYAANLDRDQDDLACDDPTKPPAPPIVDQPGPVPENQMDQTPKGGANTGVAQEKGTDATGVLLAAGGVVAIAGIAVGVRRKSGNHA